MKITNNLFSKLEGKICDIALNNEDTIPYCKIVGIFKEENMIEIECDYRYSTLINCDSIATIEYREKQD